MPTRMVLGQMTREEIDQSLMLPVLVLAVEPVRSVVVEVNLRRAAVLLQSILQTARHLDRPDRIQSGPS